MKSVAATLLCCVLLVACAHRGWREYEPFALRDSDFDLVAGAALAIIEHTASVQTIAMPDTLDRRAVAAMKRLRPTVAAAQFPGGALPAGVFLLRDFSFSGDGAAFEGDLGPTGCARGCGRNFSVPFVLRGNDWVNPSYKIVNYALPRQVIPAGGK